MNDIHSTPEKFKYDFSKRKSEDLLYIVQNPDEHTAEAVIAANNEIASRKLSNDDEEIIAKDAAYIKEVENSCRNEPLSTRDKFIICIAPLIFVPLISIYFETKGYDRKLSEAGGASQARCRLLVQL